MTPDRDSSGKSALTFGRAMLRDRWHYIGLVAMIVIFVAHAWWRGHNLMVAGSAPSGLLFAALLRTWVEVGDRRRHPVALREVPRWLAPLLIALALAAFWLAATRK